MGTLEDSLPGPVVYKYRGDIAHEAHQMFSKKKSKCRKTINAKNSTPAFHPRWAWGMGLGLCASAGLEPQHR